MMCRVLETTLQIWRYSVSVLQNTVNEEYDFVSIVNVVFFFFFFFFFFCFFFFVFVFFSFLNWIFLARKMLFCKNE